MIRSHVLICGGTGCTSSGSVKICDVLKNELEAKGIAEEIKIVQTGCFGLCALGPVMIVYPEGTFYSRVTPEDVPEIVEEHLLKGRLVQRLVYDDIGGGKKADGTPAPFSLLGNAAFSDPGRAKEMHKAGRTFSEAYMLLTQDGVHKGPRTHYLGIQEGPEMLPPYHAGAAKSRVVTSFGRRRNTRSTLII